MKTVAFQLVGKTPIRSGETAFGEILSAFHFHGTAICGESVLLRCQGGSIYDFIRLYGLSQVVFRLLQF